MTIVLIILGWLIAAGVLTTMCVRGRRVGEDPHCSKCGFNLVGIATKTITPDDTSNSGTPDWAEGIHYEVLICTDCGDVHYHPSRLPLGERHARPKIQMALALMVAVPLFTGLAFGYRSNWSFNVHRVMPNSMLVRLSHDPGYSGSADAGAELVTRIQAARLSDKELDSLARRTLTMIEDTVSDPALWSPDFNNAFWTNLANTISNRRLTPEETQLAFELSFSPRPQASIETMQGAVVPLAIVQNQAWYFIHPSSLTQFQWSWPWMPWEVVKVTVDGKPLPMTPRRGISETPRQWNRGVTDYDPRYQRPIADLPPGAYQALWTFRVGPLDKKATQATRDEMASYGLSDETYEITLANTIVVVDPETFQAPVLIQSDSWDGLVISTSRVPDELELSTVPIPELGLAQRQAVPFEVWLYVGDSSWLLSYGACIPQIPVTYFPNSRWMNLTVKIKDQIRANPDYTVILRSTRESADHLLVPSQLVVPPHEIVFEPDDRGRLKYVGQRLPNPLAIELGLVDENGVPASKASTTDGP